METKEMKALEQLKTLKATALFDMPEFVDYLIESVSLRMAEPVEHYESYPEDCNCPYCDSDIAMYKGYVNNCPHCGKAIDWEAPAKIVD